MTEQLLSVENEPSGGERSTLSKLSSGTAHFCSTSNALNALQCPKNANPTTL